LLPPLLPPARLTRAALPSHTFRQLRQRSAGTRASSCQMPSVLVRISGHRRSVGRNAAGPGRDRCASALPKLTIRLGACRVEPKQSDQAGPFRAGGDGVDNEGPTGGRVLCPLHDLLNIAAANLPLVRPTLSIPEVHPVLRFVDFPHLIAGIDWPRIERHDTACPLVCERTGLLQSSQLRLLPPCSR
jgi:hypothetical protein